jgi:hypothetical protein
MATRISVGGKKAAGRPAGSGSRGTTAPTIEERLAALEAEKVAKDARIAELEAKLEAKPARVTSQSGRTYEEAATPFEVAVQFLEEKGADGVRDLHHLMVQRVPNTATKEKRYGDGVLEKNKNGQDQYKMKPGLDRGVYIRLGKLAVQLYGSPMQYRKPQPLSEEQINGILRPALDHLNEHDLFTWDES